MIHCTSSTDMWVPNYGCFRRSSEHEANQTYAVKDSTFNIRRGCGPVAVSRAKDSEQALSEASLRAQSRNQQIRWHDIPYLQRPQRRRIAGANRRRRGCMWHGRSTLFHITSFLSTWVSQRKHSNAHALVSVSTRRCHRMFTNLHFQLFLACLFAVSPCLALCRSGYSRLLVRMVLSVHGTDVWTSVSENVQNDTTRVMRPLCNYFNFKMTRTFLFVRVFLVGFTLLERTHWWKCTV